MNKRMPSFSDNHACDCEDFKTNKFRAEGDWVPREEVSMTDFSPSQAMVQALRVIPKHDGYAVVLEARSVETFLRNFVELLVDPAHADDLRAFADATMERINAIERYRDFDEPPLYRVRISSFPDHHSCDCEDYETNKFRAEGDWTHRPTCERKDTDS